jgi:uncharacterized membrane-anchored protein
MSDGAATVDRESLTKAPAVTLGFWIIEILATRLGETGGRDASSTGSLRNAAERSSLAGAYDSNPPK